jgi:aminoglycoside phosphotransferase (APT) family kinase protein
VHGDYSPKNVLVHDEKLILLDHEVIHIGDPGFDLGFSMTHLLSKAHHLPGLRGEFADAVERYWQRYWNIVRDGDWAANLEPRAARHTLGCMLARVRGRSPLEYLDKDERDRQAAAIVALMRDPPETVVGLASGFVAELSTVE